jgi:Resolvase, N terminal domain/Recombinase
MTDLATIGLLVRNSTVRQVGNNRSEVQADMGPYLASLGFGMRMYDEQGTSGSDLSRRKVALRMLDDLKGRTIQGIAVYDVKRLTRDEFGIDGGTIAKLLVDHDATLVTYGKTYDLRDEDDLLQFQFQCMLAGIDWRSIRNTFWQGIFKRLEKGPMFVRPPLGYMTEYLPGERPGQVIKRPAKNATMAPLMAEMASAFDECRSLGQVMRRLADCGYSRPPVRYKGELTSHWTVQTLRYILHHSIYWGVWEFGGPTRKNGQKRSNVWHKFGRDVAGKHKVFRFDVPEFAYWSHSDARRWQQRFKTNRDRPVIRERKHAHPLLGVLVCVGCGDPMIGGGDNGYVCRHHRTTGCARPQKLSEHIVCALLRTLLDDTLAVASDLAARAERLVAQKAPSDQALELAHVQERSRNLAHTIARMDNPSEDLIRELDDLQGSINRLRDQVDNEQSERAASEDLYASLERIRHAPLSLFEQLTPEQQARVYALLFSNVRIGYDGRAGARRWWVESFEPQLGDGGRVHVLHPHVARVLPWAISGRLGLPSLRVDPPAIPDTRVNGVSLVSVMQISDYLCSLTDLARALSAAS